MNAADGFVLLFFLVIPSQLKSKIPIIVYVYVTEYGVLVLDLWCYILIYHLLFVYMLCMVRIHHIELDVLSGYMHMFPDFNYRFRTVTDMLPIELYRFRYLT